MTTRAISAYGVELRMGDGVSLASVAISNVSNTTPMVVTTAAHGIPVGDVDLVAITGVTGTTAANGTWIVLALSPTTLRLRESVGNGAYAGGGTLTRLDTFTHIAEITDVQDAGLAATLIDVTSHDGGGYAARIPTFLMGNAVRINYNLVPSHPTHNVTTGLLHLAVGRISRHFLIVWPDAARTTWMLPAWVANNRSQAPVAGALTTQATLEIDGAPLFAAA